MDPTVARTLTATWDDGSQVLVTEWSSGQVEVAKRGHADLLWGPPAVQIQTDGCIVGACTAPKEVGNCCRRHIEALDSGVKCVHGCGRPVREDGEACDDCGMKFDAPGLAAS